MCLPFFVPLEFLFLPSLALSGPDPQGPTAFCTSFFPFFGGRLGSYIDELLGGPCPDIPAHFGPLPRQI